MVPFNPCIDKRCPPPIRLISLPENDWKRQKAKTRTFKAHLRSEWLITRFNWRLGLKQSRIQFSLEAHSFWSVASAFRAFVFVAPEAPPRTASTGTHVHASLISVCCTVLTAAWTNLWALWASSGNENITFAWLRVDRSKSTPLNNLYPRLTAVASI